MLLASFVVLEQATNHSKIFGTTLPGATACSQSGRWSTDDPPMFDQIPFDRNAPERILRRDYLLCSKIGTFRDFIGSSVLLIIKFDFFHDAAGPNNRPVLLERAFGHFRLFCSTQGKHPAMHSFTNDIFYCSSAKKYPWCKTKGSDTMLLIDWLQYLSWPCLAQPTDNDYIVFLQQINRTARVPHKVRHPYKRGPEKGPCFRELPLSQPYTCITRPYIWCGMCLLRNLACTAFATLTEPRP